MNKSKKIVFKGHWQHPGGKLLEEGAETLSDSELLAILISTGTPQRPAMKIAEDLMDKFQSFRGMADQDVEEFMKIKGLGKVKLCRIAAAFEMSRRIVDYVLAELEKP
jgi:DNA repair protein RadC